MSIFSSKEDDLKKKYQPALDLADAIDVDISNVSMQGDKLYIKGSAPDAAVKNKVWDRIKLINPDWQKDLICDIDAPEQPAAAPPASPSTQPTAKTYTVQPGDTLSKIAKQQYGNANDYMKIAEANKLSDPNKIYPGQVLTIP